MASLIYSSNALNVLSYFYGGKKVVYVEGQDDLPFWNKIFLLFNLPSVEIKHSGGIQELKKIEESVRNAAANVYIARDTDYEVILGLLAEHPRILRTLGHSIENSLYSPQNIAKAIAMHSRTQEFDHNLVLQWIESFAKTFEKAIALDITNESLGAGHKVLGDNSCPYLNSNGKACSPNQLRLNELVTRIQAYLPQAKVTEVEAAMVGLPLRYIIRGHFLTNAVINFIKTQVKSVCGSSPSLSPEGLYLILLAQLSLDIMDGADMHHLTNEVAKLKGAG